MIKKMFTFFKKFEKLVDVLIKVQRGLIVCKTCLEAIIGGIKTRSSTRKTLENVLKYVDTANDAIATILKWFGYENDVCTVQPRGLAEEELVQLTNSIRAELED